MEDRTDRTRSAPGVLTAVDGPDRLVLVAPCDPRAVAVVRDLVVRRAHRWGARGSDALRVVVSELVTNAVRHAGSEPIVRLTRRPDHLVVEVADAEPEGRPQLAAAGGEAGGFGLVMVQGLASAWGHRATTGHKVVWATIPTAERHSSVTTVGPPGGPP